MSKTLEFIKYHNFGYKVPVYTDNENNSLKDVLNLELLKLGNVDIPYYLDKNNVIDLSIYNITDEEFEYMIDEFYLKWLDKNDFNNIPEYLNMFKMDCNMKKYQCYIKYIIKDIIIGIEEIFECKSDTIKAIWLSPKIETDNIIYTLKTQYVVLSDMDELGVLVAYNNSEM